MSYGGTGVPEIEPNLDPLEGSRRSRILGNREGGRSVWIAVVSTVVFFAIVVVLVVNSPGWSAPGGVKDAFFNKEIFIDSFPKILDGFWLNVKIFLTAEVLVLMFALVLAIMRGLPGPVFAPIRLLAVSYSILFRGVPTILVIFILGFGMPALELQGVPNSDVFWAIVALTLVYTAYVAEVYKAGIESVHPSQTAAARSLGLKPSQALRFVVLPQAVRRVLPPLLNDFIGLQKDSALVAVLGVTEGLRQAQITQATFFNFTPYVSLALVFVVITIPQVLFVDWLIKRDKRRRQAGGVA
ncbi:MAG TPA: amino acid ABC transporter permease [Actinomycetota bacterium]|nr:amino acid ABC transporter permease [Actinomycetota bacterium]